MSKETQLPSVNELRLVRQARHTTLKQLCEKKRKLEQTAREHALASALQYYETTTEQLKETVFANWLQGHAFCEKFTPLNWIV